MLSRGNLNYGKQANQIEEKANRGQRGRRGGRIGVYMANKLTQLQKEKQNMSKETNKEGKMPGWVERRTDDLNKKYQRLRDRVCDLEMKEIRRRTRMSRLFAGFGWFVLGALAVFVGTKCEISMVNVSWWYAAVLAGTALVAAILSAEI